MKIEKYNISLEREFVRINSKNKLVETSFPKAFGCKEKNPLITADDDDVVFKIKTPMEENLFDAYDKFNEITNVVIEELYKINQYIWTFGTFKKKDEKINLKAQMGIILDEEFYDEIREKDFLPDDIEEAMRIIIEHAEYVLSKTPDMLPVLKEAGVVDSGGQGLVVVLKGMYDALTGKVTDFSITESKPSTEQTVPGSGKGAAVENVDIKFGYCTEFIIMLDKEFDEKTEADFKAFLTSIGDSIVCVALDDIVKVHVHTNHPGQAFEKALEYGQLTKMKVDNMREEHNQKVVAQSELQAAAAKQAMEKNSEAEQKKAEPAKDFGFITIAPGSGIAEIFKGLGVDEVIEGGQTMNPSTEDILNAADKINAKTIYVLPNNSNIILAANQAASIVEDKELIVIPTKTVPQGITAMINFETTRSAKDNGDAMTDSLSTVKSGQLTYAVRDTSIDGKEIKKDNYLGLGDKGLAAVGTDMDETLLEMIESMMSDEAELISVYYGADVEEAAAEAVVSKIEEKFPDVDVELQFGGQPVYYYIVSVE